RRPRRRALEVEVLDEVRYARETLVLLTGTSGEEQDEARRKPLGHRRGDEPCASLEPMDRMRGGHGKKLVERASLLQRPERGVERHRDEVGRHAVGRRVERLAEIL